MRWFWIDRFKEFVSGQSATSVKNVSLSEECVEEYAPGRTYCPSSLIVEGLAQTGGLLIGQLSDFRDRIVLAKISKCQFYREAYPGDTLTYHVNLGNQEGIGAVATGTAHVGEDKLCDIELMFARLDEERFKQVELFEPAEFCRMIRLLRVFEVGVNPDGTPITVPQHMVDAEQAVLHIGI
jgi:3-hydroxyacyl-[acyl-carrier-protein] dehydratase